MKNMFQKDIGENVQDQLASLSDEVAVLRKQLGRQGRSAYKEAVHLGEEASDWVRQQASHALPEIRRGTRYLQRTARDNPTATIGTAAVGLFVLGMAVAFMMRR